MEITQEAVQKRQGKAKETRWEEEYYAYLAEKEAKIVAEEETNDKDTDGEKAVHDDSAEDWAVQYQEYCIEKERALDEAEKKKKKNYKRVKNSSKWMGLKLKISCIILWCAYE